MSFHQLHEKCNNRIKYKKVCPVHGEVPNTEIVSAYEYEKGKYVVVDDAEKKEALKSDEAAATKSIRIETFVTPDEIDPLYFEGRSYYLLPDGEAGEKPYSLLCQAMRDEKRCALAEAVLWRRERLLLLRPAGKLLTMSIMRFAGEVREPKDFLDEAPRESSKAAELRLAKRLIADSFTDKLDWSVYENDARKHMQALVEKKVSEDETIATEEDVDEVPSINLMDALKKSLGRKSASPSKAGGRSKGRAKTLPLRTVAHRSRPKAKPKKRKVS